MFENYVFTDILGEYGEARQEYNFLNLDDKTLENIGYALEYKEQLENDLIECLADNLRHLAEIWANESLRQETERNILLMREDLRKLLKYDDEFVFRSLDDNEILIQSECDEIEAYYKRQGSKGNYHAFNEVLKQSVRALQKKEA